MNPTASEDEGPVQGASLQAVWFNGRSAAGVPVSLQRDGDALVIQALSGKAAHRVAWSQVQWPERTRHGKRLAHLPDGGSIEGSDPAAWDAWTRACGSDESLVVRLQQSWRGVALSMVLLVSVCFGAYRWGVPWAAQVVVNWVPQTVEQQLGESVLRSLDGELLLPSKLAPAEQALWRERTVQAVRAMPPGWVGPWTLEFRSVPRLGPNAFALPGGTVIVTDELLALAGKDTDMVMGVIGHELGHVRRRHGLHSVAQASALAMIAGAVWGDVSTLLATMPVILGQAAYSRDAERKADTDALMVMQRNQISPQAMVRLFDALDRDPKVQAMREGGPDGLLGIAIATHPPDAERRAFFQRSEAQQP